MKVVTNSEKVLNARKTILELLMSDHPSPCARQQNSGDCELETLAKAAGASQARFAKRTSPAAKMIPPSRSPSTTTPCILATAASAAAMKSRIIRPRPHGQRLLRGIAFDLNSPMGDSTCISCGECMVSCPTGALTNKSVVGTAIAVGPDAQGFEAEDLLRIPVFQRRLRHVPRTQSRRHRQTPLPQRRNHLPRA